MDTRRISGPADRIRSAAEPGTDTVPIDLVELVELRSSTTARHGSGLGATLYVFALLGVLAVIVALAIATSGGWTILNAR